MSEPDVVIVGGGIAGGALALYLARAGVSVTVLERQSEHRDLVRGEMLSPWGTAEAQRMGIDDALYRADPLPLRRWVQWDEIYDQDEAPVVDLQQPFVPGVEGPLAISHFETCRSIAELAAEAGVDFRMGITDVEVVPGVPPRVLYAKGEGPRGVLTPRLVVGAGGHWGPIGRQLGVPRSRRCHHWGGGLAVEGLDEWPAGVQAMGTEGERMFYILPQANGRARLYLNCSEAYGARLKGANRAERFLEAFFLDCMPYSDLLRKARPAGPCMIAPSFSTTVEEPYLDGVVLIGDEAGYNDPILGTGLSNSFRDARIVGDILLTSSDWTVDVFRPFGAERRERLRKLNFSADVLGLLNAEFGPDAMARRRRAWERMRTNPNYMAVFIVGLAGPDVVPEFAFTDYLVERLVAPEKQAAAAKTSRLVAGLAGSSNGGGSARVPAQRAE